MDSSDSEGGAAGLGAGRRKRGAALSDSDDGDLRTGGLGFGGGRRRGANDDSLYGVFAEGGEDERPRKGKGARGKGGGGGGPGGGTSVPHRPVAFVRGETVNAAPIPKREEREKDEKENEEEEIDPRFRFDGAAPQQNEKPVEEGPQLRARNKLSMGQMASNYGVGYSMLKKMGFTGGGLGAKEDGIANPIEVNVRQGRQGLQDEGEMMDQDLYGREVGRKSVEELLSGGQKRKKQKLEPSKAETWKRGEAKKVKTVYKTAAELAQEPAHATLRIVDMRGPEVRVASSYGELAEPEETVRSLKELRHNARLLVSRYEERVRKAAEAKRRCEDVLLTVARERERLKSAEGLDGEEVTRCRELAKEVEALRLKQDEGSVKLWELERAFQGMLERSPREFKALRLLEAALALGNAVAKKELASWRPLERPKEGLEVLACWRAFLTKQEDGKSWPLLCEHALMPPLRAALCEWSPRETERAVLLVEACRERLPGELLEALATQVLVPRLKAELEGWDPRRDRVPVHLWIHPWLPLLGKRLDCLWTPLRLKLARCLESWAPGDTSALEVVKPWKTVLDEENWRALMEKVLLRLEAHLGAVEIKPSSQELHTLNDFLAWLPVAPVGGLARALESAFFPRWHAALRSWLEEPGCDFGEVLQWYGAWKQLFPPELAEQGAVQRQLGVGLQLMRKLMAGESPGDAPRPQRPTPAAFVKPQVAVEEVSLSLSEFLEQVASEQGLVFRPKSGVAHLGKQVYQLGGINVCLGPNLVYAAPRGGGEGDWSVVSVDEAMRLAQNAKKKAA